MVHSTHSRVVLAGLLVALVATGGPRALLLLPSSPAVESEPQETPASVFFANLEGGRRLRLRPGPMSVGLDLKLGRAPVVEIGLTF